MENRRQYVYTAVNGKLLEKGSVCVVGNTLAELNTNLDKGKIFVFKAYRGDDFVECFAFEGGVNASFAYEVCPSSNAEAYFAGMEGKPLQMCVEGVWLDISFDEVKEKNWFDFVFRVIDLKYEPFANNRELLYAWEDKTSFSFEKELQMPLVWVRNKTEKSNVYAVTGFRNDEGEDYVLLSQMPVDLKELFAYYEFLDGSPCGKEIAI